MNWNESQEERERRAEERKEALRMSKEDFARAKRSKFSDEKETLIRDAYRRIEKANWKS